MQHDQSRSASGPRGIKSLMTRLMARTVYDREQATNGLAAAWDEVAPEVMRGRSQPGTIRRPALLIRAARHALG